MQHLKYCLFCNYGKLANSDKTANTVKHVLRGHSKIDKPNVLKPCGSSMQFKSTAFCNTFDLH